MDKVIMSSGPFSHDVAIYFIIIMLQYITLHFTTVYNLP